MSSVVESDRSYIKHLFSEKAIHDEIYSIRSLFKEDHSMHRRIYSLRRLFKEECKRQKQREEKLYLERLFSEKNISSQTDSPVTQERVTRFYLENLFRETSNEKPRRVYDLRPLFKEEKNTIDHVTYYLRPLFDPRPSVFDNKLNILASSSQKVFIDQNDSYPLETSSVRELNLSHGKKIYDVFVKIGPFLCMSVQYFGTSRISSMLAD